MSISPIDDYRDFNNEAAELLEQQSPWPPRETLTATIDADLPRAVHLLRHHMLRRHLARQSAAEGYVTDTLEAYDIAVVSAAQQVIDAWIPVTITVHGWSVQALDLDGNVVDDYASFDNEHDATTWRDANEPNATVVLETTEVTR